MKDLLLSIAYKNGRYWLYHSRDFTTQDALVNPAEQAWVVLKHLNKNVFKDKYSKKHGYRLTGGDTIKFGRVRFVVKRISSEASYHPMPTLIMKEEDVSDNENILPGTVTVLLFRPLKPDCRYTRRTRRKRRFSSKHNINIDFVHNSL